MAEANDIYGTAFKNGSVTLLARIVDQNGGNLLQGDLSALKYTVYILDDQNADSRTAVEGHVNVPLNIAEVVFNTLQMAPVWTLDTLGYNFRHVLDVSTHQAFTVAGRRYLLEYQLVPLAGQTILVRFRINVI